MRQPNLDFPVDMKTSTKYIVYADVTKYRMYHETSDSYDMWATTKKEYKHERLVIGIVDNEYDVPTLNEHVKNKASNGLYGWTIEKVTFTASAIELMFLNYEY
jgi:hypothetical protein